MRKITILAALLAALTLLIPTLASAGDQDGKSVPSEKYKYHRTDKGKPDYRPAQVTRSANKKPSFNREIPAYGNRKAANGGQKPALSAPKPPNGNGNLVNRAKSDSGVKHPRKSGNIGNNSNKAGAAVYVPEAVKRRQENQN